MITRQFAMGIAGSASAVTVVTGFRPTRVTVINISTAGMLVWISGMMAGGGLKTVTAGTQTYITSAGITVTDYGFTIGTDATNAAPTVTTTATGAVGQNQITVASATGIAVGQCYYGLGIPAGTFVTAVASTLITLSNNLTQAMSATACGVCNLVVKAE